MELKVWVEGIQRIVCGVTDATTCQDVVFALAHATQKTGRFTLIERWRSNDRFLAPNESPMKILSKLGEYSSEVQFILQKSEKPNQNISQSQRVTRDDIPIDVQSSKIDNIDDVQKIPNAIILQEKQKQTENVGIVKGIRQQKQNSSPIQQVLTQIKSNNPFIAENTVTTNDIQERKISVPNNQLLNRLNLSNENLLDIYNNQVINSASSNSSSSPIIGVSGSLNPPPYRNPPVPKLHNDSNSKNGSFSPTFSTNINDILMQNVQYRDLVQLIKYQRDKITNQQNDLTKFDAEIVYLENKGREQLQQLEAITQELNKTDQIYRQGNEHIQTLQYVEEENDLGHHQEKALKSEIALLRSKLAILETELLQCRNKIKKLMDEIKLEQRNYSHQQENRQQVELKRCSTEVDRLQSDIDFAMHTSDSNMKTTDNLRKEVMHIELNIAEKKKQLEILVHEMKEVNLQSLTVSTDEAPLEGSSKTGRRIIGSPRQLENAIATTKNPHGVWV